MKRKGLFDLCVFGLAMMLGGIVQAEQFREMVLLIVNRNQVKEL